jgi:hypothetical protein
MSWLALVVALPKSHGPHKLRNFWYKCIHQHSASQLSSPILSHWNLTMISTHTLLSSLLISLLVNSIIAIPTPRAPLASLPITRHVNAAGSSKLADADRARANILKSLAFGKAAGQNGSPSSFPVTNKGVCVEIHALSWLVLIFVLAYRSPTLLTSASAVPQRLVSKFWSS